MSALETDALTHFWTEMRLGIENLTLQLRGLAVAT